MTPFNDTARLAVSDVDFRDAFHDAHAFHDSRFRDTRVSQCASAAARNVTLLLTYEMFAEIAYMPSHHQGFLLTLQVFEDTA